jgi:acyl-CoA synthetase (AMP-forming)/AMP-acid ligase II
MKDVIKSSGSSFYVRELEQVIAAYPALARLAAFGLAHRSLSQFR